MKNGLLKSANGLFLLACVIALTSCRVSSNLREDESLFSRRAGKGAPTPTPVRPKPTATPMRSAPNPTPFPTPAAPGVQQPRPTPKMESQSEPIPKGPFRSAGGVAVSPGDIERVRSAVKLLNQGDLSRDPFRQDSAKTSLEQVVLANPRFVEARTNLGIFYDSLRDDLRAEEAFREVLVQVPGYLPACTNLGALLVRQGRNNRAVELLRSCLASGDVKRPGWAEANLAFAEMLFRESLISEARQVAQRFSATLPDDGRALWLQGSLELSEKKYAQALEIFEKARAKSTGNSAELARLQYAIGECAYGMGETQRALREWEAAIATDPNYRDPSIRLARLALAMGDTAVADNHLRRLLTLEPQNPDFHLLYGTVLRTKGDFVNAELEYLKSIRLRARSPEAYFNLGVLYHKFANNPERAKLFYQKYLEMRPEMQRDAEVQNLLRELQRPAPGKGPTPAKKG